MDTMNGESYGCVQSTGVYSFKYGTAVFAPGVGSVAELVLQFVKIITHAPRPR